MSGIALAGLDGGYVEVTPQQLGDLESRAAGRLIRAGEEGWDKAVLLWNGMMAKAPRSCSSQGTLAVSPPRCGSRATTDSC